MSDTVRKAQICSLQEREAVLYLRNRELEGAAHSSAFLIACGRITVSVVWQNVTSTDRRLFEADGGLTCQEAAEWIDNCTRFYFGRARGWTMRGIMEGKCARCRLATE